MATVNGFEVEVEEDGEVIVMVPLEEYIRLEEDSEWLSCLEEAGVDDWEGVHTAQEIFDQRKEEQN